MTRRNKQIAYGAFYLICWLGIGYGIYTATLKPPASCFDQKLNQDETEVDCGGLYCESCDIRRLFPIRVSGVTLVPTENENTTTALVEFQNINTQYEYGASSFKYAIEFFGTGSSSLYLAEGEAFIYPREVKQKALVNLPFNANKYLRYTNSITDIKWQTAKQLSVPSIQTREIKLTVNQSGQAILTGIVRNNSPFPLLTTTINGYVRDTSKNIVGASKTSIQDVTPNEERFFQIVIPLPNELIVSGLEPRVSVEAKR